MPHSPYTDTVYPPIHDLEEYRRELRQSRSRYEEWDGDEDTFAVDALLNNGDTLLKHCDFLNTKLNIKKRECSRLVEENEAMETKNEPLENKIEELKKDKEALLQENESMKKRELEDVVATAVPEQLIPSNDENGLRANPSGVKSGNSAAETDMEGSGDSRETMGAVSPRKRQALTPTVKDEKATKRRKKG